MTQCDTLRSRLLEADLHELRGEGEGEVAVHVRTCTRCRRMAGTLLAETALLNVGLNGGLDADPPPLDVDAVLRRARMTPMPGGATDADQPVPGSRRSIPPVRWARWAAVATLAAAAGLSALLLLPAPGPDADPTSVAGPTGALPMVQSASADLAVLTTNNPDITVLWFF